MAHKVETMAYANQVPWHGLGNPVSNKLTPEQMLKAAQLNWTVSKRKMAFQDGDSWIPTKGDLALVRDSDKAHLTTVGETWKPVQNAEAFDFFKKFVVAGHMNMETAGSLWGGRYVWGLARIGKDFALPGKDEVRGYLLLASPHVHGKSMIIQFTSVRVVCWNTLTAAVGSSFKGRDHAGKIFRLPHSTAFTDDMKKKAEEAVGLAKKQMDDFKEASVLLSKKKAKPEQVEEFFCEVLQFDPKDAAAKKEREPVKLPKFRHALEYAPGQTMATAAGTWWGALNAVTYVIDHETGRERSTSLRNAWLGNTAQIKRRALDLALQKAS